MGVRSILALAVLVLAAGFGVFQVLPAGTAIAAQTVPYKVNFQGRLTDNNGNILADGLYNIKFRLWDALSAGVNKYEEDRIITGTDNRIQVTNGLFNIQFGDVTALTTALFSGAFPLYLEVELPTPATATCATNACAVFTEGAMTPRQPLASSPYAFNADTLDGVDSTAFSQLSASQTFTGTNTFQPTTNIPSVLIKQNSSGSFGQDVFNVSGSSSGNFIQVTSTAANQGAVTVQSLGANALTLQSGSGTIGLGSTTLVNSTGTLTLNSGSATNLALDSGTTGSILIGGDTTNAKIISVGPTAANANTTTLNLGVNTAGTQAIKIGSAGSGNAAAGTTINIQAGTTANTAVTIGTNAGGGITIDTGTTGSILIGNGASAKNTTIGSTNTTSTTFVLGGTTGSVGIGSVGTSTLASTINIATTSDATGIQLVTIGSNANAANAVTIDAGNTGKIQLGNSSAAHTIQIGAGGVAAGNAQTISIGSGTTTTASALTFQGGNITTTNGNSGIILGGGFSTSDTNLVGLTLDSTSTYTETASTCSNTANGGTIYYNSASNSIRACIRDGINLGGNWEDLPSTAGLGAILFGVVPDSGLSANQGDWAAIGGATVGPCKTSWASATTVSVAPCNAYSGGRKVVVAAATTVTLGTGTSNGWNHVCFNTSGALITPTSIQASETAGLPTFSANNPVLCLADVQMINGTGSSIAKIYDVRTFTTTTKEFVTNQTTLAGLGQTVSTMAAVNSVTQVPTTTNTSILRGVVLAQSAATSNAAITSIIATRGPQWVKFAAAAGTLNAFLQPITGGVAGYVSSSATVGTIGFGNLGLQLRLSDNTTCTTTANCQMSVPTDINLR